MIKQLKSTLILLLLLATGKFAVAQQDTAIAIRNNKVLPAYVALHGKLIQSDFAGATAAAKTLTEELPKIHLRSHDLNDLMSLKVLRKETVDAANTVATAPNINEQRKQFAVLSQKLWELAGRYRFIKESTIYYNQCPMTGVTWISDNKTIQNPYYPKNMLTCGEIKAQL
ncbi:DUF3347 domain-containing protein [Mucilaginibacter sp. RS28]|uniref:DUF3347 domain-containing protein n=1 Tax=Mucilaginibacter straminoryzae TaxID=2932774 RepID=A0A9X1X0H8_9SPHI|nr:DUF3347 domain-containing protein [Mucilaginibacter straminoryzae]MCJ8208992.1 DUF3347 domain-containing protein [Mucilaginibacter straminoryzae]